MKNPEAERRRHPRIPKGLPLKIKGQDFDFVTETINISRSGAYCQVSQYIAPMTKLGIIILLSIKRGNKTVTKKLQCQGAVVRTEEDPNGGYRIAVFFSEISGPDSQKISQYVESYLNSEVTEKPHLTFYA